MRCSWTNLGVATMFWHQRFVCLTVKVRHILRSQRYMMSPNKSVKETMPTKCNNKREKREREKKNLRQERGFRERVKSYKFLSFYVQNTRRSGTHTHTRTLARDALVIQSCR